MDRSLNTIKWILLVSLLVNAAFAGFVFSRVTNRFGFGFGGPHPGMMREAMRPRVGQGQGQGQDVSEQSRAVLTKVFADEKGDMEQAVKEWVAARRKTMQVLRAEPLDKAALDTALADMRAKTVAAQEVYHRVVVKAAPELSSPERVLLARILNAGPNRFGAETVLNALGPQGGPGGGPGQGFNNRMPPGGRPGEGSEPMGPPPPPKEE